MMQIYAIGDGAITLSLGNQVNDFLNKKVIAVQQWIWQNRFSGLKDVVVGYTTCTLYYDAFIIKQQYNTAAAYNWVKQFLEKAFHESLVELYTQPRTIHIPVCYDADFGTDIKTLAESKSITAETLINIHSSATYRVYMVGFLPGFAYMGTVDATIAMPRKQQPQTVAAGSVGIAGYQTGIYPISSPGGWHIIGRTPLPLFTVNNQPPVLLQAGDEVRFEPISKDAFNNWTGQ
jgi:inhibitor of KinA